MSSSLMRRALVVLAVGGVLSLGACGGDGGDVPQGRLGGKAVRTDGQRVRAVKMVEDVTDPYLRAVQVEVCGKHPDAGRFYLEVNHRRTVSPLTSQPFDVTPDCVSAWANYNIPPSWRPTAVVYAPDARKPWNNKVRFSLANALPSSCPPEAGAC